MTTSQSVGTLMVFLLVLTTANTSAFTLSEPESKQLLAAPKVRRALLAAPAPAPAPAPGPFTLGAFLPNSDPSCDPRWAYETGCYSDYSCAKGHICTCKNGERCADGDYFGIFLCPCDEAPQIPLPPPRPRPPPPPPTNCIYSTGTKPKCLAAFNKTDATAKCIATGGTITFTSSTYTCTCCRGSPTFSATPPTPSAPPPPPRPVPNYGKHIRNHVWTIIGCVWGGLAVLITAAVTGFCCLKRRRKARAAARARDLEQPPLIRSVKYGRRARSAKNKSVPKKWFDPGYQGPGFQATKAGLVFTKSPHRKDRFVGFAELFASASDEAGPSSASTDSDEGTAAFDGGAERGDSSPAASSPLVTGGVNTETAGKGKEPEVPAASPPGGPAPASIDGLDEDEICIVCCNAPKECVFVPCGHHATCMACGHLVQQQTGKGCPVCRRPIERVLRIYEA